VNENWHTITGDMSSNESNDGLNDFSNSDGTNVEMWNVPLGGGSHGESVWLMGDMNWTDQSQGWSR
jgi:hypothetical protein